MLRSIILASAVMAVSACAYPVSETVQGGQSSSIYFESFPAEAVVIVNGTEVGRVADFDGGEQILAVPEGTNSILVRQGGNVLFDKKVFVGRNSNQKISR
jgi:hypothetical protein